MDIFDITNLTDEELEELLTSATNEKQRRDEEVYVKAEKVFYEAACALYNIDPWYTFSISASDLEEREELSLGLLLQEMEKN